MSQPNRRTGKAVYRALFLIVCWLAGAAAFAQEPARHYAVVLDDPPVAQRYVGRQMRRSSAAQNYRQQIEERQRNVRAGLETRHIQVTGSVSTLVNAIFVAVPESRAAELKALPGVKGVVPMRRFRPLLNRAATLVNAPAAWTAAGGIANAGKGIKIAILDSGIDQTHPAFQDSSLPVPAGFPKCSGSDCAFTNNKVIVARSYVSMLAAGSNPSNPAADSRPDDYSARDRSGHGTAVASCAAGVTNTGAATITGIAPQAYLGNYKIYGSPGVNDFTGEEVIIKALDDAISDGMDIASYSSGAPAFSGALDSGADCGNSTGVACDLAAQAFENAAKGGMVIVAAAGNGGFDGQNYPSFNTISSPADAPSVIAVGASTNSHRFGETVSVPGANVPANLQSIQGVVGDGFIPPGSLTAPLRDVTKLGNDGLACVALPFGSLGGAIALIERGSCDFTLKVDNAEQAGAVGVILYMADSSSPISPSGLSNTFVPVLMVSNADGLALKNFIDANADHLATIDPSGTEVNTTGDLLASFSSAGPAPGDSALKPDLVAVGTNVYMAAENFDPLGDVYSADRYALANGTSFATPIVSGAAAMVKQAHPSFTAAQVKSALVNTAAQDITLDDQRNPVGIQAVGAGKLDVGAAVKAGVTITPATLSFGAVQSGTLPLTRQLQLTNTLSTAAALSLAIVPANAGGSLSLDRNTVSLAPGATTTVSVTLSGSMPSPGAYSGSLTIQGSGQSLHVPYLFLVGDGVAGNLIPLTGDLFDGTVNAGIPDGVLSFKLVDDFGLPISGAPVSFTAPSGGTLSQVSSTTDRYGIGYAVPTLGSQAGSYSFVATAGGLRHTFTGTARPKPNIWSNGIVGAAGAASGAGIVPGSYISIYGTGLSDATDLEYTARLPLAIDYANVSFDVPSAGISVPGHLTYVSPTQVNVQVPWQLQGQTSVQVKVTIDYSPGNVVTVPVATAAPAFFEVNGMVAALDTNYKVIAAGNPARRGQVIQLFANGLGPVTNQPASGEPAPIVNDLSQLSQTTAKPVVTIGGVNADVSYSGLAPGFAGLYQINVTVPAGLNPGTLPVVVTIDGQKSGASNLAVQ